MKYKLSQAAIKRIEDAIDDLFDKAKVRFLGPQSVSNSRSLYIGYKRILSLPGIFEQAHIEGRAIPDLANLNHLVKTANNYIEALRHKAKAQIVGSVQAFLLELKHKKGDPDDLYIKLESELDALRKEIASNLQRIIETESQRARNTGLLESISRVNASVGVEDPTVFFVVVRDADLCDECRTLHLLPDGKTPRVWKLSELGHGYHKRGEENPKVGGLHPHCRCTLTTLMPGFGFNKAGRVTWIRDGHDEHAEQRS